MININPANIVPITQARSKLDDLVRGAKGSTVYAISRQGKVETAIVELKYLRAMADELRRYRMQAAKTRLQEAFTARLKTKGLDPEKLSQAEFDRQLATLDS